MSAAELSTQLPDECKLSTSTKQMISQTAEDLVDYLALGLASLIATRFPKLAPVSIYIAKRMMQHFTAERMQSLLTDAEQVCGRIVSSTAKKEQEQKDAGKLDALLMRRGISAPQGSRSDTKKATHRLNAVGVIVQQEHTQHR